MYQHATKTNYIRNKATCPPFILQNSNSTHEHLPNYSWVEFILTLASSLLLKNIVIILIPPHLNLFISLECF